MQKLEITQQEARQRLEHVGLRMIPRTRDGLREQSIGTSALKRWRDTHIQLRSF